MFREEFHHLHFKKAKQRRATKRHIRLSADEILVIKKSLLSLPTHSGWPFMTLSISWFFSFFRSNQSNFFLIPTPGLCVLLSCWGGINLIHTKWKNGEKPDEAINHGRADVRESRNKKKSKVEISSKLSLRMASLSLVEPNTLENWCVTFEIGWNEILLGLFFLLISCVDRKTISFPSFQSK